jgi:carbamate kinase
MKLYLISLYLFSSIIFTSCDIDGYGKKITISERIEVFIKNDATEADAKKMGNFFDSTWKELTNKKSFQLSKDSGNYTVRMVVDAVKVKKDSLLDVSFWAIKFLIEEEVFKGSAVKLILTDDKFTDIKTF